MGYYACQTNVLYKMQFCDTGGLNHSVLPDILHVVLLGYVTRLITGFACLKKQEVIHTMFFLIERDLLAVGRALSKQSDIHLPQMHFPSGYLPNPKKSNDNTSGRKCS